MQLIAADIGNSSTWLATGRTGLDWTGTKQMSLVHDTELQLRTIGPPAFWSICSVNSASSQSLSDWITANRPHDQIHPIQQTDIDLETALDAPQSTGIDRLLAAWMAVELATSAVPIVIVDAGTAVTIDLVDADRIFQGGFIFPGYSTSLQSLSSSTYALPDLRNDRSHWDDWDADDEIGNAPGRDTRSAIIRGVRHSQLATIEHLVRLIRDREQAASQVFATGGGMEALRPFLPGDWFYVQHLVLQGAYCLGSQLAGVNR